MPGTTPTSMVKRLTGDEAFTDALNFGVAQALPAGSTIAGRPIPGGGSAVVNTTATSLALTSTLHANKVVVVDSAAPFAFTLPAATGSGDKYELFIDTPATTTTSTISTVASGETMAGLVVAVVTTSNNAKGYVATSTDNTISLNGSTKGGVKGDRIVLIDVKASQWAVTMFTAPTGSDATPFSHV